MTTYAASAVLGPRFISIWRPLGSTHISNVHILAKSRTFPLVISFFRSEGGNGDAPDVHHANALHLYPQASYWDWHYTADKLPGGQREKQIGPRLDVSTRHGASTWNCRRDVAAEGNYWDKVLADYYASDAAVADSIRKAYDGGGEIAPKLLRRFGITEGNRQTLLLGMFISQLVNPYKYTIYPGFYESCGPEGENFINM